MKIEFIEKEAIEKAKSVFDFAYIKTLESDLNVMQVENDNLYEIDSNGNKKFIKKIKNYKIDKKSFNI